MIKNLPVMQKTCVQPWVRKIPWRREWLPTPVFLSGEFHGQRSLVVSMELQRVRHSRATHTFTFPHRMGVKMLPELVPQWPGKGFFLPAWSQDTRHLGELSWEGEPPLSCVSLGNIQLLWAPRPLLMTRACQGSPFKSTGPPSQD